MGVVAEIERKLSELRCRDQENGVPEIRTSTMTHLVWCPPEWLPKARATLAGLLERHPARTIFLIPEPGRGEVSVARVQLKEFELGGEGREVLSEVLELRLRGNGMHHPASIVLPLLVSDLPVFCRWRGEPRWDSSELHELLGVVDRLVVNSSEWRGVPRSYERLLEIFGRTTVSDIAFSRTLLWRRRLADLWPEIASLEKLRVEGPRADAELLAGWLRSRLRRDVALSRREAPPVTAIWVDGKPVAWPGESPTGSDLLSAELDQFGRDPVYEAAVRAVTQSGRR